jgi:hypothetical protein
MSYYNQPDHELIDRRDVAARRILLRLANATTDDVTPSGTSDDGGSNANAGDATADDPVMARWRDAATTHNLPAPDRQPLAVNGHSIWPVWRTRYVAASLADLPESVSDALDERGIGVVVFGPDQNGWPEAFEQLTTALGR